MRLVKKTVNQDDIQTYHLFFTDDIGSPGTDMIFREYQKGFMEQTRFTKHLSVCQMTVR